MFRKILKSLLCLMCACCMLASAELTVKDDLPELPLTVSGEYLEISVDYDAAADLSRYTAKLTGNPVFPDGTPVTAQDMLFSLYVRLDPSASGKSSLSGLPIAGLDSYRLQVSDEELASARETMSAIRDACSDHVWNEDDPWSAELQDAYWQIFDAYTAACDAEFPKCAKAIVRYCDGILATDYAGAFGKTNAEIASDDGLRTAYAMLKWGYARYSGNVLTAKRSYTTWKLDAGEAPSIDDFVRELRLTYDDDLAACWAVETTGTYTPVLPDMEAAFLDACYGSERSSIPGIAGIRMTGDSTVEIDLTGISVRAARELFSPPVMSLNLLGDPELWKPEEGLYGHPFGEVAEIEAFVSDTVELIAPAQEIIF